MNHNHPVRDDFPYSNQWYVQYASLDLTEGNNLFDEEYIAPYLIKKDVSDKVQYNISFSPKEAYGDKSVQIKLRLLDSYSNSKYIYIDYNFSAEDRGTLASSNISELITGNKTDMNLEYVNIPPLRGTGFITYPSFNPPSKWDDLVKGELDKDTNKGYITALKDFDEGIYLIYKNDYRESGKQPHLYFSRIYLKKSKAKE